MSESADNRRRRFFYHVHLLLLHQGAIVALFNWDWRWFWVSMGVYTFLQIVGGNIALHRYFSHHSFETSPLKEKFLIVIGNLTALGSSISWVTTHTHHHRHADQANDCHSPHHLSWKKILWGYWNPPEDSSSALRSLHFLKWHLFFHHWYYALHFLIFGALLLVDWKMAVYVYALPNLMVYYALYSVVLICHLWGRRSYSTPDESRNNRLVALYTFGEGWHNNHHQSPKKYSNSHRRGEFDPTAKVIDIFFKT